MLQLELQPSLFSVSVRYVEADRRTLSQISVDIDQAGAKQGVQSGQGMDER